jgi:hypothetical protein
MSEHGVGGDTKRIGSGGELSWCECLRAVVGAALFMSLEDARLEPAAAGGLACFSASAVACAVAARVAYTGYSTVNVQLAGGSPGDSQFQRASSSKTTSRDTCTRLEAGSYILYALDPSSYPMNTIGELRFTRVNSTNVLNEGLRIGEIGRQMNSKVKLVEIYVYRK